MQSYKTGSVELSHTYRNGAILGSRDSEKGVAVMVDNPLTMHSQCSEVTQRANSILGCTNMGTLSRAERLFYLCTWHGCDRCWVLLCCPQLKNIEKLERIQRRVPRMIN